MTFSGHLCIMSMCRISLIPAHKRDVHPVYGAVDYAPRGLMVRGYQHTTAGSIHGAVMLLFIVIHINIAGWSCRNPVIILLGKYTEEQPLKWQDPCYCSQGLLQYIIASLRSVGVNN